MDHQEAIATKAAERYLLGELTPQLRDAFEEHAFDCSECALDLRAGAVFIQAARAELANLPASATTLPDSAPAKGKAKKSFLATWLRPAFIVPAFGALILVIAFQNLSTIPNLRTAIAEPHILPATSFHAGTRGKEETLIQADKRQGFVISVQLPEAYSSYEFTLYDPQGKRQWTRSVSGSAVKAAEGTVSLFIPGQSLQSGSYSLSITGTADNGGRSEIERRVLKVQLAN